MNLKKIPDTIPIYGDVAWRGTCPVETAEESTFFNRMRIQYPKTWGLIAVHVRNEGKRSPQQMAKIKAQGGFVTGASDILIPGSPAFCCEMKRKDHTKSTLQDGQVEFLEQAQTQGAFVCVALGCDAAWVAFKDYLAAHYASP